MTAQLVPFRFQASTSRNLLAQLDADFDYVSGKAPAVTDHPYGAVGDGVTDNTAALAAAFAAGVGYFPDGVYVCDAAVVAAAADNLNITGPGSNRVRIHFPNASAGISLTYDDQTKPCNVSGVTLTTAGNSSATAISITGPTLATAYMEGPKFNDVVIRGASPATDTWAEGIHLTQVWYPYFNNVVIKGGITSIDPYTMAVGFHFTNVQGMSGRRTFVQHVITAVLEDGTSLGEGWNWGGFEYVGVNTGFNIGGGVATPVPGTFIGDGHINASLRGIVAASHVQTSFAGLLIYKTQTTTLDWIGMLLSEVHGVTVDDVFFGGNNNSGSGKGDGIVFTGASTNNIVTNIGADYFNTAGTMCIVENTSDTNVIDTSTFRSAATGGAPITALALVANTGTGTANRARPNLTQGAAVASANNLALGYDGDRFQISGTTQVNLLSFQDWPPGSRVTLGFQGIVTVKHNQAASGNFKPIFNPAGADITTAAGTQLTLQYDGTDSKWYVTAKQ